MTMNMHLGQHVRGDLSLGSSVGFNGDIYHLLRRSFGQCVADAEVVDFNVLDIVSVRDIDFAVDVVAFAW